MGVLVRVERVGRAKTGIVVYCSLMRAERTLIPMTDEYTVYEAPDLTSVHTHRSITPTINHNRPFPNLQPLSSLTFTNASPPHSATPNSQYCSTLPPK